MSREELLTLLAVLIRVHGEGDTLLCSKAVCDSLGEELSIDNRHLPNGDIELTLIES